MTAPDPTAQARALLKALDAINRDPAPCPVQELGEVNVACLRIIDAALDAARQQGRDSQIVKCDGCEKTGPAEDFSILCHDGRKEFRDAELDMEREARQQAEQERDALRTSLLEILPYAEDYMDEGPPDEGWQSDELCAVLSRARQRALGGTT